MSKTRHQPRNPRRAAQRICRALKSAGASPDAIRKFAEQGSDPVTRRIAEQVRRSEQ